MLLLTAATVRLITFVVLNELTSLALALPRTRGTGEVTAKSGMTPEPTCEELKAMWRFSKRQSRAAEITNEIPMYRDPFVDNVWEPYYATSRSIGGQRIGRFKTRPVYGHVVHKPPYMRIQDSAERQKAFEEVVRLYAMPPQTEPRRKITTFRLPGGRHLSSLGFPPQQGSFQHLKELIKTERARELQQQRASEESAARAAALKELSDENQRNHGGYYDRYDYDSTDDDDLAINTVSAGNKHRNGGVIAFPDLLAPAARPNTNLARFVPEYGYSRSAARTRARPALLDSSFNTGYSGYLP